MIYLLTMNKANCLENQAKTLFLLKIKSGMQNQKLLINLII